MSKIICLDPGHGGLDSGAVGNGLKEKDITLTVALAVKHLLETSGVNVVMTRETDQSVLNATDVDTDLGNRCKISNESHADLFLSIHVNSGGGNGAEIYVMGNGGDISSLALDTVQSVGTLMGLHGEPVKDGSSLYVINSTEAPAMLIEIGFIDSSDSEKLKNNLSAIAELIAKPLIPWLGGSNAPAAASEGDQAAPVEAPTDYKGSAFEPFIQWVIDEKIMVGDGNGHFRPNDPLTRAEMAVVVKRIFDHILPAAKQDTPLVEE